MSRIILSCIGAAALCSPSAHANTLRYNIGGLGIVTVADNSPADLDPVANQIRIKLDQVVVTGPGTYRVRGSISAKATPVVTGKPQVVIESLRIENTAGNVIAGTLWLEHQFSPTSNLIYNDVLRGRFNNVLVPGWLNGGSLSYTSRVRSSVGPAWFVIASGFTGNLSGAAPIPFQFLGGPVTVQKADREEQSLIFYLDSPGDALLINTTDACKFSAASLLPGALLVRRRRRAV